ncbi:Threonylcarbamoyl-AMP synthase [Candidatus Hepatincolaceae symbiont of Richtersius coronifer]
MTNTIFFQAPKLLEANDQNIKLACEYIKQQELVAFPTETVYGLGASCYFDKAIEKIYALKGRPKNNPLIVHFANTDSIKEHFIINEIFEILSKAFMPGPLTLILEKKPGSKISPLCANGSNKQAFRIPNNPIALKLITCTGPLVAPSANISNKLSPTLALHVKLSFMDKKLSDKGLLILDGGSTQLGLESTVLDISDINQIKLLRHGSLGIENIEKTGIKLINHTQYPWFSKIYDKTPQYENKYSNALASPGMLNKHYSPNTPLRLNALEIKEGEALLAFGKINFLVPKEVKILNLSQASDLAEAASNFFKMLWELDLLQPKIIAVMPIPQIDLGLTINERLQKASAV